MSLSDVTVNDLLGERQGKVETVSTATTVDQAARRMADRKIGMLVVINEMGNFAGVLSDGDIVRTVANHWNEVSDVRVGDLITVNITACKPENNLREVMETMKDKSIRHLPVLDRGQIVGVVSAGDLLRYLLDEYEDARPAGLFARLRGS
jgi:CBS domain-containing protein